MGRYYEKGELEWINKKKFIPSHLNIHYPWWEENGKCIFFFGYGTAK
ncbi:hypothetical protein CLK_2782 [Clostridium botulinum A3 str. Loch Maree]|nr:hypothetical protein CLK_2782 [Clostridium botulinum A3 str. Loch Maree]